MPQHLVPTREENSTLADIFCFGEEGIINLSQQQPFPHITYIHSSDIVTTQAITAKAGEYCIDRMLIPKVICRR